MSFHAFGVSEGGGTCISLESMLPLSKTMTPPKKMMSQAAQVDVNM